MKILFLDIDGVLNCPTSPVRDGLLAIDPAHVRLLANVIERTECNIVISSTWRRHHSLEELKELFREAGLQKADAIIGVTDDITTGHPYIPRGSEILKWMNSHPEVTRFAIVDDDEDFLLSQKDNFVRTYSQHGLTQMGALSLISILNRPL